MLYENHPHHHHHHQQQRKKNTDKQNLLRSHALLSRGMDHQRHTHAHTHTSMHTHNTCVHACVHTCTHMCTYAHTCACTQRHVPHHPAQPHHQTSGGSPRKGAGKTLNAASGKCTLDQKPSQHGEPSSAFPSTLFPSPPATAVHPPSLSSATGRGTHYVLGRPPMNTFYHFRQHHTLMCPCQTSPGEGRLLEIQNPEGGPRLNEMAKLTCSAPNTSCPALSSGS